MNHLAQCGALIKSLAPVTPPLPSESSQCLLATDSEEVASQVHQSRSAYGLLYGSENDFMRLMMIISLIWLQLTLPGLQRQCDEVTCSRCTAQVKKNLLDATRRLMKIGSDGLLNYCLNCHELTKKNDHRAHEDKVIPLDKYKGELVAWVKGKEKWAALFHGIQVILSALRHVYISHPIDWNHSYLQI